jgi:predicted DNA-binding ribbon-helix-helix protein
MVAKNFSDEMLRPRELDNEVSELSLLLPNRQIDALEQLARAEGITVAQLLRRVVNRMLTQSSSQQAGYYYG